MNDLVSRGLDLAIYGMGTVFVFLTLLVLTTMLMSWLVQSRDDEPVTAEGGVDPATLAAIGAAVRQYRNRDAS